MGALGVFVAVNGALAGDPWFCVQILLFAFTYLWVAINRYLKVDGRGLGWFCLFVALSAAPWSIKYLTESRGVWPVWLAINWLAWAVLWFMFFLLLALKKSNLAKITGWVTPLEGISTGWLPGWLLLSGYMELAPQG